MQWRCFCAKRRRIGGAVNYVRVNKAQARRMYRSGITIRLLPCKCADSLADGSGVWIKPSEISLLTTEHDQNQFDRDVNEYEWYNCQYHELGYYAHYYVTEDDLEAFN